MKYDIITKILHYSIHNVKQNNYYVNVKYSR